jgi:hypothetical protein
MGSSESSRRQPKGALLVAVQVVLVVVVML